MITIGQEIEIELVVWELDLLHQAHAEMLVKLDTMYLLSALYTP
jgi:hypothetical protein